MSTNMILLFLILMNLYDFQMKMRKQMAQVNLEIVLCHYALAWLFLSSCL